MTLFFHNPGSVSIEALVTLGVNAKGEGAIGQFGTGAKYAIAGVLRLGGTLQITSQDKGKGTTYSFSTRQGTIRQKDFSFVYMSTNGQSAQPLGFTTALGAHWEPWMLYRELWSNAKDEGGGVDTEEPDYGDLASTIIEVQCPELKLVHQQHDRHILDGLAEPLWSNSDLEIYQDVPSIQPIFYRGIRVAETTKESAYVYNILSEQQLTEDRTLSDFYAGWAIMGALVTVEDRPLAESIVLSKGWEEWFHWEHTTGWSKAFKEAVKLKGNAKFTQRCRSQYFEEFKPKPQAMTTSQHQNIQALLAALPVNPWQQVAVCEDKDWETQQEDQTLWLNPKLDGRELQLAVLKAWKYDVGVEELLTAWLGAGE